MRRRNRSPRSSAERRRGLQDGQGREPMSMIKMLAGAVAIVAVAIAAPDARAAEPGTLVTGDNLPANLDPHQIFDVPMQLYSLNTYDNLYRYLGNPPELKPWL